MDKTPVQMRNELAAQHVIKNLNKRQLNGYYAETAEEALKLALSRRLLCWLGR